jgi:hypothetical protein
MLRNFVATVAALSVSTGICEAQDTAFVNALRAQALSFSISKDRLDGPGAAALRKIADENQFIMLGEDHGIREVPELAAALWQTARPAGFSHIAVEIGPLTGRRLETMLRSPDGQRAIDDFLGKHTAFTLPFFFWKEESQMLESVVKSANARRDVVWGIDQEFILSPTYLLERLAHVAPTAAARSIAADFARASARGDSMMIASGNPGAVWMVTTSDTDIARLKKAFNPSAGSETDAIIRELSVSRDIYASFNRGTNYESNQQRANLMKSHFMDFYRAAQSRGERSPKVMVKLGANHVFRGPSITGSYEMGTFLPELAASNGTSSYGILVVIVRGTWNAFRPFGSTEADKTQKYDPLTTAEYKVFDLASVLSATDGSRWSFIDLRPVRARTLNRGVKLDPRARRLLDTFDGVIVVPEGHASVYFR